MQWRTGIVKHVTHWLRWYWYSGALAQGSTWHIGWDGIDLEADWHREARDTLLSFSRLSLAANLVNIERIHDKNHNQTERMDSGFWLLLSSAQFSLIFRHLVPGRTTWQFSQKKKRQKRKKKKKRNLNSGIKKEDWSFYPKSISIPNMDTPKESVEPRVNNTKGSKRQRAKKAENLKRDFRCDLCCKAYESKKGLDYHMRTHSNENNYICEICGKSCATQHSLDNHVNSIHLDEKLFSCYFCDKAFNAQKTLNEHCRDQHENPVSEDSVIQKREGVHSKSIFRCETCFKTCATRGALHYHKRSHSNASSFNCRECLKSFAHERLLENHVKAIHLDVRSFPCETCGKTFPLKSTWFTHVQNTHLKAKKYPCEYCGKNFTNKSHLTTHVQSTHLNEKFSCEQCGKCYNQKPNLDRHVKTIHLNLKSFSCERCDKSFSQKGILNKHVNAVHLNHRRFSCSQCEKTFTEKHGLRRHVETVHLKHELSGNDCSPKSELSSHTKTLHSDKTFPCDQCGRVFNWKGTLKRHVTNVHLDLRAFSCEHCGCCFKQKGNLNAHVKSMHENMKFFCKECDQIFNHKSNLNGHIRRTHWGYRFFLSLSLFCYNLIHFDKLLDCSAPIYFHCNKSQF